MENMRILTDIIEGRIKLAGMRSKNLITYRQKRTRANKPRRGVIISEAMKVSSNIHLSILGHTESLYGHLSQTDKEVISTYGGNMTMKITV